MKPDPKAPTKLSLARIFSFLTLFLLMGFFVLGHPYILFNELPNRANTELLQGKWEKPKDVLKIDIGNLLFQKEKPDQKIRSFSENSYQNQRFEAYLPKLAMPLNPVDIIFSFIPLSSKFNIPHLNADEEEPQSFI